MKLKNIVILVIVSYSIFLLFGSMFLDVSKSTLVINEFANKKIETSSILSSSFEKSFNSKAFNPNKFLVNKLESAQPNTPEELQEIYDLMLIKTLQSCKNHSENNTLVKEYLSILKKHIRELNKVCPSSEWKKVSELNKHLYAAIDAYNLGNENVFIQEIEKSTTNIIESYTPTRNETPLP